MKFEAVPLLEAKGKILGHNIAGANGQRLLRKGKPLTDEDLEKLRALGRASVYVARLEPDDVDENSAARRVAEAVSGAGLHISSVASGRANWESCLPISRMCRWSAHQAVRAAKKNNTVYWILPRLLAGDSLTRRDIVQLGHGRLLQDVPERGMPRETKKEEAETESTTMIPSRE